MELNRIESDRHDATVHGVVGWTAKRQIEYKKRNEELNDIHFAAMRSIAHINT